MSVTGLTLADRDAYHRQIDRLANSNLLHGSESLCKLLRYLATQTIDHPGAPVKEYQIATEVFGRPSNFDPRVDSTVRVQTGRLRSKLAEYYASAGAEDPLVIEIPRGAYTLIFHHRATLPVTGEAAPAHPEAEHPVSEPKAPTHHRGWLIAVLTLAVLLAGSLAASVYLWLHRQPADSIPAATRNEAAVFRSFWKFFIDEPAEPWVVFSNAEFVGRPETGMRYFNPATDSRNQILDHYTGVGEVIGIHELDHVFKLLNHGLRVKRGRLLSLDDAKNNDLIFIGSPSENLTLREIPSTQEFVFRRTDTPTRKGDLAIVNVHPKPGEQDMYFATPAIPLLEDYSIVALVPGVNQSRWAMILAGTTTLGTQAAVEYVSRARSVEDLLTRLSGSRTGEILPFEAVLKVKVASGVPVHSDVVALRATK